MSDKTYAIIGSDGSIERYDDAFADETPESAITAEAVEREIIAARDGVESSFLKMAFLLDTFDANQYYLGRSFTSTKEWCEDPSVEIGWRLALDLMRIPRKAVPALEDAGKSFEEAIATLAGARVSKIRAALPLLEEGKADDFVALMEDAPSLTLKDVNREVRALRTGDEDAARPVLFKAFVTRGDTHSTFKIVAINGQTTEDAGTLRVRNEDAAPRLALLFGDRHVEYVDA